MATPKLNSASIDSTGKILATNWSEVVTTTKEDGNGLTLKLSDGSTPALSIAKETKGEQLKFTLASAVVPSQKPKLSYSGEGLDPSPEEFSNRSLPYPSVKASVGLSVALKIGGTDVPLTISDLTAPQPWVFGLPPGQTIQFSPEDIINWLRSLGASIDTSNLPQPIKNLINDTEVKIPTFQVSTAGMINVALEVEFQHGLLSELGVPPAITKIIDVDSFSLALQRKPAPSNVQSAKFKTVSSSTVSVTVTFTAPVTVTGSPTLVVKPATGDLITCKAAAETSSATVTFTGSAKLTKKSAVKLEAQMISIPEGASIVDSQQEPVPLPLIESSVTGAVKS